MRKLDNKLGNSRSFFDVELLYDDLHELLSEPSENVPRSSTLPNVTHGLARLVLAIIAGARTAAHRASL